VNRINIAYVFQLGLPVAFLCFLAPVFLLPAAPAFLINIISDFPPQHTINYQYAAALIPFVFIALIFAVKKFKKWMEGASRYGYAMTAVVVVVLACALAGSFFFGPSPIAQGYRPADYSSDRHIVAMNEGLAKIPADASVSAQTYMLAKLSDRQYVYQFPEPFRWLVDPSFYREIGATGQKIMFPNTYRLADKGAGIAPEYVALDRGGDIGLPLQHYDRIVAKVIAAGYRPIFSRDGVIILKKQ
jgi:uncharacterized membrane protein